MKKVLSIVVLCFSILFSGLSQEWGKLTNPEEKAVTPALKVGDSYYMVYGDMINLGLNSGKYNTMEIRKYDAGKEIHKQDLLSLLDVNKNEFSIEKLVLLGDSPVLIYTRQDGGNYMLCAQKFAENCKPSGQEVQLHSYSYPRNSPVITYEIYIAANKKQLAIRSVEKEFKKIDENISKITKIFDEDLQLVSEQVYEKPESGILHHKTVISNTAEIFDFYKETQKIQLDKKNSYTTIKHLFVRKDKDLESLDISLKNEASYGTLGSAVNDKQIASFMFYYRDIEKHESGVSGIYLMLFDLVKQQVIVDEHLAFDQEFLSSALTGKVKEKEVLSGYEFRNLFLLNDNSQVLVLEKYKPGPRDPKTGSETGKAHFDDVLVLKINPKGELSWYNKIRKEQEAAVYGETEFASINSCLDEKTMFFVFNDDKANYDDQGNFIATGESVSTCTFSKKSAAIAFVEIDLVTGKMTRKNAAHGVEDFQKFMIRGNSISRHERYVDIPNQGVVIIDSKEGQQHLRLK